MQRTYRFTLLAFLLLAAPQFLHAEAAPPATRPAIDPKSARGALKAFNDQLPAGGTKAALSAYHATNAKERTLAKALARADVAAAKLQELTLQKFGQNASDEIVHAMRLPTDADLADATEKVDGDHATIDWADGRDSLLMVRVNGKWKVAVDDLLDDDDKDDESAKTNIEVAEALEQLEKKLQAGDFANTNLLERAVKQKMFRILGEDDADD